MDGSGEVPGIDVHFLQRFLHSIDQRHLGAVLGVHSLWVCDDTVRVCDVHRTVGVSIVWEKRVARAGELQNK